MNVEPLTEEEIATLSANLYYPQEYSLYHALLETIRQRTEAAEYSTQCWEIASQKWAEALRQRDEAVALLSDYRYLVCSQQARDRIEAFLAALEHPVLYCVATDDAVAQAVAEGRMV